MARKKATRRGRPRNNPGVRWSGRAFREVLSQRTTTMAELSEWLEVSVSTVSTWARYPSGENSRPPSEDSAKDIAAYLRVPLEAFSSAKAAREHV